MLSTLNQNKDQQANKNIKEVIIYYVLHVYVLNSLTFVIFIHICYPNAISNIEENNNIWQTLPFLDFHVMSFVNSIFIWYKFMIIWCISRAWALIDEIEKPENMNRCIYNNYSFSRFWRLWHRSSIYKSLNMWVVFTLQLYGMVFNQSFYLWCDLFLALILKKNQQKYFDEEFIDKNPDSNCFTDQEQDSQFK
ncbi:unnamed protein product [Paramecium sonneborni]|uniref:Uncharacterized protein n=1 Tax=Paramecium sonneborni TaxID=65129 RepID=A0A8S1RPI5_9CILI|nr:unnamed protein product [Paramecium sonneborni]